MKITYAYWRSKQGTMVYAVKLVEQHGERIVIGAVGPLGNRTGWSPAICTAWLPYYKYETTLARVLDAHQDEYEEVTL